MDNLSASMKFSFQAEIASTAVRYNKYLYANLLFFSYEFFSCLPKEITFVFYSTIHLSEKNQSELSSLHWALVSCANLLPMFWIILYRTNIDNNDWLVMSVLTQIQINWNGDLSIFSGETYVVVQSSPP